MTPTLSLVWFQLSVRFPYLALTEPVVVSLLSWFLCSKVMTALVDLRESADKSNKQKINPASYSSPDHHSQTVQDFSQ